MLTSAMYLWLQLIYVSLQNPSLHWVSPHALSVEEESQRKTKDKKHGKKHINGNPTFETQLLPNQVPTVPATSHCAGEVTNLHTSPHYKQGWPCTAAASPALSLHHGLPKMPNQLHYSRGFLRSLWLDGPGACLLKLGWCLIIMSYVCCCLRESFNIFLLNGKGLCCRVHQSMITKPWKYYFFTHLLPMICYLHQGTYAFGSIGLFVCLSVCLLATSRKKLWLNFY